VMYGELIIRRISSPSGCVLLLANWLATGAPDPVGDREPRVACSSRQKICEALRELALS
jgi:hypothetical protein